MFVSNLYAAPATLMIDSVFRGDDLEGAGAFVLELAQADLSGDSSVKMVERRELDKIIKEQGLASSGLTDPSSKIKLGKLLSAKYMVSTKGVVVGERMMIVTRIVQVETSLFRNKTLAVTGKDELETISNKLTKLIKSGIKELGEDIVIKDKEQTAQVKIPENYKRPKMALYIPEATDGLARAVDPACEHVLLKKFGEHQFEIVQLKYSSHAITFGEDGRPQGEVFQKLIEAARDKGVEVIIIGEAFSQRAGTLGQLSSARARVELHAVKVSDQSVMASASGYGVAVDAALGIAGKKAIEDATKRVFTPFVNDLSKK